MTVTPSMTPKTTVTGILLACIGTAGLMAVLQLADFPGPGGWRHAGAAPALMAAPIQTRGTNALFVGATLAAGDVSTARGRN